MGTPRGCSGRLSCALVTQPAVTQRHHGAVSTTSAVLLLCAVYESSCQLPKKKKKGWPQSGSDFTIQILMRAGVGWLCCSAANTAQRGCTAATAHIPGSSTKTTTENQNTCSRTWDTQTPKEIFGGQQRKSHLAAPGVLTSSGRTHLSGSSGGFICPWVLPIGKCRPSFPFLSSPGSWRIPLLFLQFASLPLSLFSFSPYP